MTNITDKNAESQCYGDDLNQIENSLLETNTPIPSLIAQILNPNISTIRKYQLREVSLRLLNNDSDMQKIFKSMPESRAVHLTTAFMLYRREAFFTLLNSYRYPKLMMELMNLLTLDEKTRIINAYATSGDLKQFVALLAKLNQPTITQFLLNVLQNIFNITINILRYSIKAYCHAVIELCNIARAITAVSVLTAAIFVIPAAFIALLPYTVAGVIASSMVAIPLLVAGYSALIAVFSPLLLLCDQIPLLFLAYGTYFALDHSYKATDVCTRRHANLMISWDKALTDQYPDVESKLPERSKAASFLESFRSIVSGTPKETATSRESVHRLGLFAQAQPDTSEACAAVKRMVNTP